MSSNCSEILDRGRAGQRDDIYARFQGRETFCIRLSWQRFINSNLMWNATSFENRLGQCLACNLCTWQQDPSAAQISQSGQNGFRYIFLRNKIRNYPARFQRYEDVRDGLLFTDARYAVEDPEENWQLRTALDRARKGDYGTCDECGEPIPAARLRALPGVATCVRCQERLERGA